MDADDLYGLPLDRFVSERASLVRALRSEGEREQAAEVAALRKPSVAAWAVNQLVRTQRHAVDSLFATGDALREAQADVLAGSADSQDLRSAAEQERTAVDDLVSTARGLLSSTGQELSPATLERVSDTLHAAALDDEARAQVSEARLVRELRHVGLGGGVGLAPPAGRAPARPSAGHAGTRADARAAAGTEREAAKERRAAAAAEQRAREQARKQARTNERDAAREVERAERAVRGAQDRRDRAAEALAQAEEALAEAQAGHDAALSAHRQAKQQLHSV